MAQFISLETDFSEAMEAFEELDRMSFKIQRSILAGVGSKASSMAKKSYSMSLKKKTGNLYKNIKRVVTRSGNAVIIYSNALSENKVRYGFVLSKGTTIKAKDDYLTFQIDGKWIKKKSVRIPERDWIVKPIENYIGSIEYDSQIDRLIQKEVDKLFKKGVLK
jgi:hypothetical protein